jgi:maltose/maltodextrin transport system substrate-binding protein/arabinogalactan oligomer/maltooligosaccharide transport system substrate-binding protein
MAEEPTVAPTEAPAAEEPAPTEAPAPESAVECPAGAPTLLIWADDTRAGVLNDLAPTVLAETGVCLSIQLVGFGDIRSQMSLAGPAGEGADIFVGAHDWLGELYANGVVAPMDLGAKAADFAPVALEAFSYEGTLYGLPYAVENVAFVCNPDLVPEPPATWSEVQEMSQEAKDAGDLTQFFAIMASDPYHHEPINTAFGGYIFGQTEAGYDACDVGLDSEGAVAYLTWIDTMVKDGMLSADIDWETAHVLFETGKAACMITGPWALERFETAGVNYNIGGLPGEAQDASPFVGVQGFMINSFSPNKVLAQSFLTDYIATTPVMEALYLAGDRPPAFLPAEGVMDDNAKAFASIVPSAHPMPAIPAMNAVWDAWGTAITTVFQQSATPADAAATAAQQVRAAAGCE